MDGKDHPMNEELQQLLKNLRLRRILDIYDEQLRAADKEDVSYTELVTPPDACAVACPSGTGVGVAYPQRQAPGTLVTRYVSVSAPARRQSQQIRSFAELEFIAKKENIVFIGPTGV